jgi:hypothetical protein
MTSASSQTGAGMQENLEVERATGMIVEGDLQSQLKIEVS